MKKYLCFIAMLLSCMAFCACGKEKDQGDGGDIKQNLEENMDGQNEWGDDPQDEKNDTWDDIDWENVNLPKGEALSKAILSYENHPIDLFCVGENGVVYAYDRAGKKLCEYNTEGKCAKEYPFDAEQIIVSICYLDGKIYYIDGKYIKSMDLSSGNSETIHTFGGDSWMFGRMVGIEDCLFILQKDQYREDWADVSFDDEDEYTYEGELLLCYNLSTNKIKTLDIPNIKRINKKDGKELLVYAYDEKGGFYFASCGEEGKIKGKQYTKETNAGLIDIAYDDISERIVCEDVEGVFLAKARSISDKTYIFQGSCWGMETLLCEDGFAYELFLADGGAKLVRMENSLFVDELPALKAYTVEEDHLPYYGYKIDYQNKSYSELAMILLAGDSDYDFLVLNSEHDIARNIRRTGAYYPLGELAGIKELLADCHAYVGEAATAPNGDIWMLPLDVECPVLLYNEDMMEKNKYGAEFEKLDTYKKFMDWVEKVVQADEDTYLYKLSYYLMTGDITHQYLGNYAIQDKKSDFHSDVFRTYLDMIKQYDAKTNADGVLFDTMRGADTSNQDEYYSKILFLMQRSSVLLRKEYEHYVEYDYFHAIPVPGLEEGEKFKNQAEASLIVVNPNSKKLKWVLSYLEEVCKGIRADKNSLMLRTNDFRDQPLLQEVQEIIADAEIYFAYPDEIIEDVLYRYRMEGQSYEDTVNEMERKMNMYLNE